MLVQEVAELNQGSRKLVDYCEQATDAADRRAKLKADPIEVLQSLGVSVEDEFHEAVSEQMRTFADMAERRALNPAESLLKGAKPDIGAMAAAPPKPPTNLRVVEPPKEATVPPKVKEALEFRVKPWGLVLVVREEAVRYLKGGGAITATFLALLSPIPIAGAISLFFATFLGINLGMIELMDKGKGVYLTLTWPHIFLCGVGLLLPAITPIK
jgi:hypothetical protein